MKPGEWGIEVIEIGVVLKDRYFTPRFLETQRILQKDLIVGERAQTYQYKMSFFDAWDRAKLGKEMS